MTSRRLIVLALSSVACLVALGVWWFSPQEILKRKTRALLAVLTLEKGDGRISRHAGAYKLNALLAEKVTLETDTLEEASGTFDKAELESAYTYLCEHTQHSHFTLKKLEPITLSGDEADVSMTLESKVQLPNFSLADGLYQAQLHWQKSADTWRLTRAAWQKK
jgi:hypothetical protein